MRRPRRPPPPPRHPPAAPATRPSPLRSRAPSASYRPPHVAAAAPSAHSSQIMPRRRRRPISAARVPAGAPRPDPSAGAAAADDLHCLNDLARHPSHQHRRPSCLRDFDPVRFAAEGGVPREDDGQQLQLQGVHGAPQGHLLPLALRRQRPEALQAPRHAALRRVPPLLLQYIEDSVAVSMSDMEPFPATTNEICNIGTKGFPNRWWHVIAPGLLNSGFRKATKLAKGIAMWWMQTNYASYKAIGSMHEEVEHIPSQQECSVRQQDLWKIEEPLSLVGETIFLCTVVLPYEQFVSFSEFLDRITIDIFC